MSFFDSIAGVLGDNVDVSGIAEKFGLDPAVAQQAVAALGAAHGQPGDTVDTAAAQTGIDPDTLSQIVSHIGGDGALGQVAQHLADNPQLVQGVLGAVSQGDGASGLLGAASSFFGKE